MEVSECVAIARLAEHLREGRALKGGEARLLGDVLGRGVVDVQVLEATVQVSRKHHGLARREVLEVLAHVGLPKNAEYECP